MSKIFIHKVKVYYEDTDAGGVVYYANYLKFLERARSEAIYSLGFTNLTLLKDQKILIIVRSCNIKYKKTAKFEDTLKIKSIVKSISKSSFTMKQDIFRNSELITESETHLVTVKVNGKVTEIPNKLLKKLKSN